MTYYIHIENNNIISCGKVPMGEGFTSIEVSEELYNAYKQDQDRYVFDYQSYSIIENPDYEEIKQQKETARINNLTMTALDFINVVKSLGLTDEDIDEYLQANISLKNQLTYCQNVYCGVVRSLVPLEVKGKTITDAMVVNAFKVKNGETPDVVT
jgi:hypothetical protein